MRLSDLRDKNVMTLDGETLGRVHEVHCDGGLVTALVVGPGGLFEQLTDRRAGRRIPWECVRKVTAREILVTPDPRQRKPAKKASGSRTPRRTPRPSGRRSKR